MNGGINSGKLYVESKVVFPKNKGLPKKFYFFIKMVAQCTKLMGSTCKSGLKRGFTAKVEAVLFQLVHVQGLQL